MTENTRPLPSRETLVAWDSAHVWHPFTPHSVYADEDPLMIVAAHGHTLVDADGREFLDAVGSLWCNILGHRVPAIDAAVQEQLKRVAHATFLGNATAPAVELAHRLITIAPEGLTRVFYSDSGSTAVEVALKMAYQFWQQTPGGERRRRFLTIGNAYHGDTVGSVALGSIPLFHARYRDLLFDTLEAPSPYCFRCPLGKQRTTCGIACLTALENLAVTHQDELAAIVVEPAMQGAAGMISQPEGYLRAIRDIADRTGALLIVDEVAMGFGRTGHMFACDREGIAPDLMCLAKGLTGGYLPLAATLATERIFDAFLGDPNDGRTFFHGHTYTGNPLGAAAALATLDELERRDILTHVREVSADLSTRLVRLSEHRGVADIRQIGLAVGIELDCPSGQRTGQRVCIAARDHGVFLRPLGDVLILMPPLTITTHEVDMILTAIVRAIDTVWTADQR